MDKFGISKSNVLDFIWADDCLLEIRYFVLIFYINTGDNCLKFVFGCDLSLVYCPKWDKQFVQSLQIKSKKEKT